MLYLAVGLLVDPPASTRLLMVCSENERRGQKHKSTRKAWRIFTCTSISGFLMKQYVTWCTYMCVLLYVNRYDVPPIEMSVLVRTCVIS